MSSAWTVGVTLGSATTAAPTVGVVVARVGDLLPRSGRRLGRLARQAAHGLARDVARPVIGGGCALACVPRSSMCPPSFTSWAPTKGPTVSGVVYTALSLLLTILLFSTARRGNGWTGVHELLSRTRVVQRNALRPVASAAPKASPADLVPALSSLRRVGPYAVHTMVGETGGGRLFIGVDPILRRHVWIHEVPPGTPPVDATRRDVSRPGPAVLARGAPIGDGELGRVRGAAGRAVPDSVADVRLARGASCALEPGDRARCLEPATDTDTRLTLAHVWRRADGQLVLLDFSWPGLNAPEAHQTRSAVELLAAVSTRALDPTTEPSAPLSGTTLLHRLASGAPPALADVKAELLRLASISRPSLTRPSCPADGDGGDAGGRTFPDRQS